MAGRVTRTSEVNRAARKAGRKASREAKSARRDTRRAARNPLLEMAERLGYVARGLLYGAMGGLAMIAASGRGGRFTDQRGVLWLLGTGLAGKVLLMLFLIAIGAYACWGFVRAVFDPFKVGTEPMGLATRAGFLWSGLAYTSLAVFAAERLISLPLGPEDTVQRAVLQLVALPAGRWLTIAIGLVGMAGGLAQFADAYAATFAHYMQHNLRRRERLAIEWLGRAGMVSRGVVFTLVGWFLVTAGLDANAQRAHGYGGAFAAVAAAPLGRALLALVALGFIALGLHSLASARWIRMLSAEAR